ncbi:MAG TPA: FtsW/RodA/SpoVE family cell cycle protein [Tepidisphaeraceae bacterium]|jgi:cell division protein FtsW (lipid II flippase)|nr:FtsW/RodA/SpoVE family cell cycle protein [Tepidisphaeraceae bacterium]
MNKLWKQLAIVTNWPILLAVVVLSALGLVSIWAHSIADPRAQQDVQKQVMFIAIGLTLMFAMQAVNYLQLGRWGWPFYILSLLLLIYTILPGVPMRRFLGVVEVHDARLWINLGLLNMQPAELMKVAFCVVLARYLRFRSNYRTLLGLLPPFGLAIVPLLIILKQPDLGTALVFIPALFAMLFVAGAKIRHLAAIVGLATMLALVTWFAGPEGGDLPVLRHLPSLVKKYQRARVMAMFSTDPAVLRGAGFQQLQAEIAFGSGQFAGRGALNIPVGTHVPEAHNDMIFALIGEQFGFLGALVLLGGYLVLFAAGVEIAANTKEPFGRLVAVGIVSLCAGQTFLNLMVTLKLMPVTGVTLPFVSYGGSSIIASFMCAGLLLNIGQNRPIVMARESFEFDS